MNKSVVGWLSALGVTPSLTAQVIPTHPQKFATRPIGGSIGSVEVVPKDGSGSENLRYTTHIVLSDSRLWASTDGRIVEGKLIAFEDLVEEAPQGTTQPASPAPPESPTVVRDEKIRLLVKKKPLELPLKRLSKSDLEFIEQMQQARAKKAPPAP